MHIYIKSSTSDAS